MRKLSKSQQFTLASVCVFVLGGVLCFTAPLPTPFAAYLIGVIATLNAVDLLQRAKKAAKAANREG